MESWRMTLYNRKLQRLVSNLTEVGYEFAEEPISGPSSDVADIVRTIEEQVGKIPGSLREFYLTVGGINFIGTHPKWRLFEYPDPLVIFSVDTVMQYEFEDFMHDKQHYLENHGGKFLIPIAPDLYHKENVSGGMWYNVAMPNDLEDPVIQDESHQLTFVKYLVAHPY